jgi:hypothetical protein
VETWETYTYAGADPVGHSDRQGLWGEAEGGLVITFGCEVGGPWGCAAAGAVILTAWVWTNWGDDISKGTKNVWDRISHAASDATDWVEGKYDDFTCEWFDANCWRGGTSFATGGDTSNWLPPPGTPEHCEAMYHYLIEHCELLKPLGTGHTDLPDGSRVEVDRTEAMSNYLTCRDGAMKFREDCYSNLVAN